MVLVVQEKYLFALTVQAESKYKPLLVVKLEYVSYAPDVPLVKASAVLVTSGSVARLFTVMVAEVPERRVPKVAE